MGKRMITLDADRATGILAGTDILLMDTYSDFADHVEALPYSSDRDVAACAKHYADMPADAMAEAFAAWAAKVRDGWAQQQG